MKQELKVGDYVRDILTEDIAIVQCNASDIYPLRASFLWERASFTKEGLEHVDHKSPRFLKVDPPKKKVKKTIEVWANVYTYGRVRYHNTKKEADEHSDRRIDCVKITGEYEAEE